MDFYAVLDQVVDLLRSRRRVSYRALKRQFALDDAYLDDLKAEIIEVQQLATDHDGTMLVWMGEPGTASPVSPPLARAPLTYTPPYLAEKILTFRSALEGERKQVTVLFADLKGSMELLAERDPEEARQLLDPVLERMIEAVHRYEGTVNQVMGDGIMALFGAPIAHEDHAVRACYAALRMQETVTHYGDEIQRSHGVPVQIRVGLHSGEVVVRAIDSSLHMDYTAVGQTTHLSARMEQMAKPGSILTTGETLRLVAGFVQVKALGPVAVKGLADLVEVFELVGASSTRTRLQAFAARGLTRFIGRQVEFEALRQALERAGTSHGQVVAIIGEPGVGKTRLVYEFIRSHHTHDWLVLESSSVSYGKATTYLPVRDLLKAYFQIDDRDDGRKIREKITGKLLTLDATLGPTLPAFLTLLDVPVEDRHWQALDPTQRRQRTLEAIKGLLLRESQVQPLLLVFENLHWIDAETQAVLDRLIESLPTARLLLLVNYRPEYQHGWGNKTYYTQLRLDPLPPASAEELLTTLLGEDGSLTPLRELLIGKTDGNPLFLEESVRTLVETGVLVGERGGYRLLRALETIQVPATVRAILASRIDRLPAEQKRLLQEASVVGKDVPFGLLQAIAGLEEEVLRAGLTQLQAGEFLYETSLFPEIEYTFKHALTHEVAYGSLLGERRRQLHAAIVEALERLHGDRVGEQVELLAHHATKGELRAKAVAYLRQAGGKAVVRSANREAVGFFEQALALLEDLPPATETLTTSLDTRIALGPALIAVKGAPAPEVEALYLRARKLVDRLGDESRRFPVLWGLWYVSYTRGRYPAARETGERLLEASRSGADTGQLLEAHHALWATLSAMGEPTAAVAHAEQGIALYDRERHASQTFLYGGHDPGACCRYHLALNHWVLGYPERALAALHDALRLSEELEHPLTMAIALWVATWVHHQRGDREATVVAAERLLAVTSRYLFTGWTSVAIVLRPAARGDRLDSKALGDLYGRLVSTGSSSWRHLLCLCALAELYAGAGLADEGLWTLAGIGPEDRTGLFAPELHRLEGELLLRRSTSAPDAAEACFCRALALARGRAEKSLELRAAMSLSRLWQQLGKQAEARELLAPIYGWFTEGFDTADLQEAKALLEELS
jgi:class 3 adenylate cyclase/tetratricopeptide (TPR) repeat protein